MSSDIRLKIDYPLDVLFDMYIKLICRLARLRACVCRIRVRAPRRR